MPYKSYKWHRILIFVLVVFCFQTACSVNKFRKPISNFQAATAVTTANARSALTELNRLQRIKTIKDHNRDMKPIRISDINSSRLISDEDLQARLDALDRLNEYVDLLVRIANSDAPENIAKSATDLADALGKLTTTVNGLTVNSTADFKGKFGAAGVVLSEILRFIAQRKIKEALTKAVLDGEQPINDLIIAIGDDLEVAFRVRREALEEERVNLLKDYNLEVVKTPPDKKILNELTEKIIAHEDVMDTLIDANPRASLAAMAKAHSKLVLHAKSRSSGSFEEAVEAIEVFVASAKRLGDAVLKLKTQTA